jgi:hypothetical protein
MRDPEDSSAQIARESYQRSQRSPYLGVFVTVARDCRHHRIHDHQRTLWDLPCHGDQRGDVSRRIELPNPVAIGRVRYDM